MFVLKEHHDDESRASRRSNSSMGTSNQRPMSREERKKTALKWWHKRAWMGGRKKTSKKESSVKQPPQPTWNQSVIPSVVTTRKESSTVDKSLVEKPSKTVYSSPPSCLKTKPTCSEWNNSTHNDDDRSTHSHSSVPSILKRNKRSRQTHPTDHDSRAGGAAAGRAIRFADEEGKPMATIQFTEQRDDDDDDSSDDKSNWVRFIVLMVAPLKKKFEFVHVYYNVQERNLLADVLYHVKEVATHRDLARQHYVGLCRLSNGGAELFNTYSVQDYQLDRHEVIAAIPRGMKACQLVPIATHLVNINKKVLRVMKRTKWQKRRITQRPVSRKTLPLEMEDLESSLHKNAQVELALSDPNSDLMIPRLFHTGAFLMPLVAMQKTASNATNRVFVGTNS